MRRSPWILAPTLVLLLGALLPADDAEHKMSARIDSWLGKRQAEHGIKRGALASDAEFIRRAYLDLTGVIPTVGQVREFLRDSSGDKRARLIDRLLGTSGADGKKRSANGRHATHLARVWQNVMLPQLGNNNRFRFQAGNFQTWLRNGFADNKPYNEIVKELVTYTGATNAGPGLFYQVLEFKPEELAASTSRIFLGVQIQCAQCHDHPFDHWTQKDFWSYAAFFARIQQPQGRNRFLGRVTELNSGEVKLPESEKTVAPGFLGEKESHVNDARSRREQLADWLTSRKNKYFARATVNRAWALLFGYGLVDPVDDFGKHNPPSHPELLNELAEDFANNGFNLRRLFRILAKSKAYQVTSRVTEDDEYHPYLFHKMAVKSLTAGQIFDCLEIATHKRENATTNYYARSPFQFNQQRQLFVGKFEAPTQGATEFQAGIPQALTMMNGQFIISASDASRSDILLAIAEAPFMNDQQRVETLFLAVLSRKPTSVESKKFGKYVGEGGPTKDKRKALGDVMWALLNSTEFILNH